MERRCECCAHFRPKRDLTETLRLPTDLGVASTIQTTMQTQERLLAQETGVVAELDSENYKWPHKPQVWAYCGYREDENVYLAHEFKNADCLCKDHQPTEETLSESHKTVPAKVFCTNCRHRRPARPPQLDTSGLAGKPDALQQLERWKQKCREREQWERGRFDLNGPFTSKPWFFSWCKWWTYRGREWKQNQFGQPTIVYELTVRRNKNHDCPYHEEGAPEPE